MTNLLRWISRHIERLRAGNRGNPRIALYAGLWRGASATPGHGRFDVAVSPRPSASPVRGLRRSGRAGFTLLEMLLVVVLIGVVGTMAVPQISRLTGKNSVSRAAMIVQQDLQRSFALAARLRKPVTLTASNSSKVYQVTDPSNNVLLVRQLTRTQEYGVETMTFSPTTLTIQPNGVSNSTITVTLTSSGSTRVVSMSSAGLVRRTQ